MGLTYSPDASRSVSPVYDLANCYEATRLAGSLFRLDLAVFVFYRDGPTPVSEAASQHRSGQ